MNEKPPKSEPFPGERIAKRLARAGVASRREVERLIAEGRVCVNGKRLTTPALNVTDAMKITVDGVVIGKAETTRVWRYHKKAGLLTTNRDPKGRPTVFDKLPPDLPRVVTIGRLDFNTEGLLLLTNNGELARHLELPKNAWVRHYRVRVYGVVDEAKLARLAQGITVDGTRYDPIKATLETDKADGMNKWLMVSLAEGKNREIRRVMEHLDLQVTRLIRVAYGPFQLGKLPRGAIEEIPPRLLRQYVGAFMDAS
jgi:23S rRNA pseudouridine2605 synthase